MQIPGASRLKSKPKCRASISGPISALPPECDLGAQSESRKSFSEQIHFFVDEALEKYASSVLCMQETMLPDWMSQLLKCRIVPALKRIGFDESFCWALFKMAAPAWALMGPITAEAVWFHPVLMEDIKEIRRGILLKAEKNAENLALLATMRPRDLHALAQNTMGPKNLLVLLEYIPTPWIILPRVYDFLDKRHSCCLLGYLRYLDSDSNPEFLKILARIIIEFIGNYTLKFIHKTHPKDQMIAAIFYGYAAMFWRNLSNPPSVWKILGFLNIFLIGPKISGTDAFI